MSSEDRRSPGLLERLLVQPTASETPKWSSSISKRQIQLAAEDQGTSSSKRRKTDIVDSVVEALSADQVLHSLLNLLECHHGEAKERLVVVTTKNVNYHEPARHLSRLRLVLTDDGSYYIQVLGECYHIIVCVLQ